jgi:hypothetical protein
MQIYVKEFSADSIPPSASLAIAFSLALLFLTVMILITAILIRQNNTVITALASTIFN